MKLRHLHASLLRLQEQAQLLEEERCVRVDPMQVPCGQPFKMEAKAVSSSKRRWSRLPLPQP